MPQEKVALLLAEVPEVVWQDVVVVGSLPFVFVDERQVIRPRAAKPLEEH